MKQDVLPGFIVFTTIKGYERIKTMSVEEGIYFIKNYNTTKMIPLEGKDGNQLKIGDLMDPQAGRIKLFKRGKTTCVSCGMKGNHFYVERHKNDKPDSFTLNLYGINPNGKEVLMTWDHIIPKSLNGSNSSDNSQCMCATCNSRKGNVLELSEILKIVAHENVLKMYSWNTNHSANKTSIFDTITKMKNSVETISNQIRNNNTCLINR